MPHHGLNVRLLGLSILALGSVWLGVATGVTRGIDALGWLQADEVVSLECGRQLSPTANSSQVVSPLRARVTFDDAWADLGLDSQAIRLLVVEAAGLLRGTGLSVSPVEVVRWNPPRSSQLPREVLDAAKASIPLVDVDIVIVLTAGSTTRKDGAADVGGRYVVLQHHRDEWAKDVAVLAHELGHLLGAHHGCDAQIAGGIMGATGFANAELLCPCTRRVIADNIARFHRDNEATQ